MLIGLRRAVPAPPAPCTSRCDNIPLRIPHKMVASLVCPLICAHPLSLRLVSYPGWRPCVSAAALPIAPPCNMCCVAHSHNFEQKTLVIGIAVQPSVPGMPRGTVPGGHEGADPERPGPCTSVHINSTKAVPDDFNAHCAGTCARRGCCSRRSWSHSGQQQSHAKRGGRNEAT